MGILARLNPTRHAARDLHMNIAGMQQSPGVIQWMRDHPALMKGVTTAVSLAFPPARAGVALLQTAQTVHGLLDRPEGHRHFTNAVMGWKNGAGQPITERANQAMEYQSPSTPREQY